MKNRRGVAIVTVLMGTALLAVVAMGVLTLGSHNVLHSHAERLAMSALYAAHAGAATKVAQINAEPGDLVKAQLPLSETLPNSGTRFDVTVTPGGSDAPAPANFTVPGGALDTLYVLSTGTSPNGQQRSLGVLLQKQGDDTFWQQAAFGADQVQMGTGSYTNSWHSGGGVVDHSRATVGTNNPKDGITFGDDKSSIVGYDPKKGKTAAVAKIIGPPGSTEGGVTDGKQGKNYSSFDTASELRPMPDVVIPALPTAPDPVTGLVTVPPAVVVPAGVTMNLTPGAYTGVGAVGTGARAVLDVSSVPAGSTAEYVFKFVELRDEGALEVYNPNGVTVMVYIDSDLLKKKKGEQTGFTMDNGAVVNKSGKPSQLQFHIGGNGYNKVEGKGTAAYYVVYDPKGEVTVDGGAIWGAVVANKVVLKGKDLKEAGSIHFDMALVDGVGLTTNGTVWARASEQQF